jgi:hypothetical protein
MKKFLINKFKMCVFTSEGQRFINIDVYVLPMGYDSNHHLIRFWSTNGYDFCMLYNILAIENYGQPLHWCYQHAQGWTASIELDIMRLGSYLGSDQIVAFFLDTEEEKALASHAELRNAAILGAAEAGRGLDWQRLVANFSIPSDPSPASIEEAMSGITEFNECRNMATRMLLLSHAAVIVYGYLTTSAKQSQTGYETMIESLLKTQGYDAIRLLYVTHIVLQYVPEVSVMMNLHSLVVFLCEESKASDPRQDPAFILRLLAIGNDVLQLFSFATIEGDENENELMHAVVYFLTAIVEWGVDAQLLEAKSFRRQDDKISTTVLMLQEKQRSKWAELDIIKKGRPLLEIKAAVQEGNISLKQSD